MRAERGWYSPGEGIRLSKYYFVQKHLSLTRNATEISKCSCGRCFWDWYLPLTSSAIKHVLAAHLRLPFPSPFLNASPHKLHDTVTGLYSVELMSL